MSSLRRVFIALASMALVLVVAAAAWSQGSFSGPASGGPKGATVAGDVVTYGGGFYPRIDGKVTFPDCSVYIATDTGLLIAAGRAAGCSASAGFRGPDSGGSKTATVRRDAVAYNGALYPRINGKVTFPDCSVYIATDSGVLIAAGRAANCGPGSGDSPRQDASGPRIWRISGAPASTDRKVPPPSGGRELRIADSGSDFVRLELREPGGKTSGIILRWALGDTITPGRPIDVSATYERVGGNVTGGLTIRFDVATGQPDAGAVVLALDVNAAAPAKGKVSSARFNAPDGGGDRVFWIRATLAGGLTYELKVPCKWLGGAPPPLA